MLGSVETEMVERPSRAKISAVALALTPALLLAACDYTGYFYYDDPVNRLRVDHSPVAYREYRSDVRKCEALAETASSSASASSDKDDIRIPAFGVCMKERGYAIGIWAGWPPKWLADLRNW